MDLLITTPNVEIKAKPFTHEGKMFFQVTNTKINLKTFATLEREQVEHLMEFLSKQLLNAC